ncbi:MAG: dockerin type I repeat-containing protein, partial [Acutalibacteraceae bacterium]
PYLYLDPGNHYQECKAGDSYNIQAHEFTAWTDNENGTHSRHCTVCKMTDGSAYTETAPSPGYTVYGTATSFGDNTDDVTIQLIKIGASEAAYEAIVKGNSATYSIAGVLPGTYTMRVMKKNHVMREYTVTVSAENVTQDVKICLLGDVNSDGKINMLDAIFVQKNGVGLITLSDAQLQSADVNGDGKVNIRDAIIIQKYALNMIDKF